MKENAPAFSFCAFLDINNSGIFFIDMVYYT